MVKLLSLEGGISWGFSVTIEEARLLIPSQIIWENPQCKLHVPITDKQIEAIENARNGSTINLSVQLAGIALGNASLGAVEPVQGSSLQSLSIGREQWITILKQLQYSSRRLVELPEPNIPRNILDWNECIRLLDNATLFYQRSEYEQVVTSCRSIAEGIPQVLCKMWGLPQKKQGDQSQEKWLREMKGRLENAWQEDTLTPTMLETLLVGAWKWLAPTPHYGVGIPAKEESAFALELCTGLLHLQVKFCKRILIRYQEKKARLKRKRYSKVVQLLATKFTVVTEFAKLLKSKTKPIVNEI